MAIEDIFKSFGLNQKQIQVLMASMELGSQPASLIAKKTNLNRTTVYLILSELAAYGFVTKFDKLGMQYFSPASPEKIIEIARRKKDEFEQCENALKAILPGLMSKFNPYFPRAKVSYFEGLNGVTDVLEDILGTRGKIRTYRCVDSWITGQACNIIKEFDKRRAARKIRSLMIVPAAASARAYFSDNGIKKFSRLKFIGNKADFKNEVYIYDNKIALLSFVTGSMFGVIIESDENAKTQKAIFDLAWRAK